MYCQEAAGLPIAPREINDLAVIRVDGDRDSAADTLLSGHSGAVDHEREADTFDHALARQSVTGRSGRFFQINKAACAPFIVPHYDDVGVGNDERVCREAARQGTPSIESGIDRTIRVGDWATLRTVLTDSGPLLDANGIKGGGRSDTGVERLIHRLGLAAGR